MHEQWKMDLERRMAGEPTTADAIEARLAYNNDRLPAAHPAKWSRADVEALNQVRAELTDVLTIDAVIAKLERILPPVD